MSGRNDHERMVDRRSVRVERANTAALTGFIACALAIGLVPQLGNFGISVTAASAAEPAASVDELVERVQRNWRKEQKANEQREAEFTSAKHRQAQLLKETKAVRDAEEARSDRLEKQFEENEIAIAESEEVLASRLGNLGELFGVVRQVAGDTAGR